MERRCFAIVLASFAEATRKTIPPTLLGPNLVTVLAWISDTVPQVSMTKAYHYAQVSGQVTRKPRSGLEVFVTTTAVHVRELPEST
jgi:hypothetical protein